MKKMVLAVIAVLSLGVGAGNAQSYSHEAPPHQHSSNQFSSVQGGR